MGGSFKGKKTHYDDKAIGSTYDNPGVGKGAKGKRGTGRNASDRYAPKGFGNVGCYDEDKYLNEGRPLSGGAGFFKNKKKRASTLISTTTTTVARTATTAGIRTNAAAVEIKVVEIKEEMKVEAEEDNVKKRVNHIFMTHPLSYYILNFSKII